MHGCARVPPDSARDPLRLGTLIAEGYLSPRRSMERVLALRPDESDRLTMVGIGIAVGALGAALLGRSPEQEATDASGGLVFVGYLLTVVAGLLQYYVVARVIGFFARAMGGEGTWEDDRSVVAWWTLVTAPLPVVLVAAARSGQSPLAMLIMIACAVLFTVLLAAYIAGAHRFRSTLLVCGTMFAILTVVGMIVGSLVPMPMPA